MLRSGSTATELLRQMPDSPCLSAMPAFPPIVFGKDNYTTLTTTCKPRY